MSTDQRVAVIGNRKLAKYVLRHVLESGWNIVGGMSPAGRAAARQANYGSFEDICGEFGVPYYETENINDQDTTEWLRSLSPDLCLCPGWGQIIGSDILDIPDRFLGFHASNLPEGRGGAPVNWSIIGGDETITISMFEYVAEVDAGPVYLQSSVPVERRDDVRTVFERLSRAAVELCDTFESQSPHSPHAQSNREATYRPRRQPQDGLVDWTRSPREQYDWIRALTHPYPGAYSFLDGDLVRIWEAEPEAVDTDGAPGGKVIGLDEGVLVATGDGALRVIRVQIDGNPEQWADDWVEANGIGVGDRFSRADSPPDWLYTGIRGPDGGFDYNTSLPEGETGALRAIAFAGQAEPDIDVEVYYDDTRCHEDSIDRAGGSTTVSYGTPSEIGTLRVEFFDGSDLIDRRFLKVYSR